MATTRSAGTGRSGREGCPGRLRVGTSGYQYDHWVGDLYPESLPRSEWFARYARTFDTVEINNTFYGLPGPETFDAWRDRAPGDFLYALKFSRYGTHMKHLKDSADTIGTFLERARRLEDRLGPILVQLPPSWHVDVNRLRTFLDAAPGDLRWSVELRDPSWLCDDVFTVLREAGAALCIHDLVDDHPREVTADWVYLRYHGHRYEDGYSHQKLTAEAARASRHLRKGRDVFAYFNNDLGGHAVHDASDFRRYVETRCGDEGRAGRAWA